MVLYPVIAECLYRVGRLVAPKNSWFGIVSSNQSWKNESPLKGQVVWMHCASLGEFEMGKPVLEALLRSSPETQAVVTFFSPSGYEPRKNYNEAIVHYLPIDAPSEVAAWLNYCRPTIALFIRYDLWPNHIAGLRKRSIPTMVAAMSAPKTPWFLHRALPLIRSNFIQGIQTWGMVDDSDAETMSRSGIHSVVLGNPKFDYVYSLMQSSPPETYLQWKSHQRKPIMLIGSAHFDDIQFLKEHLDWSEYCVWIVPHKVGEGNRMLGMLDARLTPSKDAAIPMEVDVLLVETFGVLRSLYSLADEVFIGGGFGKAVHNVLEASAAGRAAASGPNFRKMPENASLVREQLLLPCTTKHELDQYLNRQKQGEKERALNLLKAHSGAVDRIVNVLKQTV